MVLWSLIRECESVPPTVDPELSTLQARLRRRSAAIVVVSALVVTGAVLGHRATASGVTPGQPEPWQEAVLLSPTQASFTWILPLCDRPAPAPSVKYERTTVVVTFWALYVRRPFDCVGGIGLERQVVKFKHPVERGAIQDGACIRYSWCGLLAETVSAQGGSSQ
jgi:hypothetical protein